MHRDEQLEAQMSTVLRAVDLGRTLRSQSGINLRQPIRQVWLALPPGVVLPPDLLAILAEELNTKSVHAIAEGSDLVERRARPLLPRIGRRLGAQTQVVLAAARNNEVEYLPGGGVRLAGVDLAPDEVEILSTPRTGTAVAHDQGLVVVIDTELDDELRAEGDARELSRAIQDLRKKGDLELDESIDLWLDGPADVVAQLAPYLERLADDTLATSVSHDEPPSGVPSSSHRLTRGEVVLGVRARGPGG